MAHQVLSKLLKAAVMTVFEITSHLKDIDLERVSWQDVLDLLIADDVPDADISKKETN